MQLSIGLCPCMFRKEPRFNTHPHKPKVLLMSRIYHFLEGWLEVVVDNYNLNT